MIIRNKLDNICYLHDNFPSIVYTKVLKTVYFFYGIAVTFVITVVVVILYRMCGSIDFTSKMCVVCFFIINGHLIYKIPNIRTVLSHYLFEFLTLQYFFRGEKCDMFRKIAH